MSKTVAIRGAFLDFIDDPWHHVGAEEKAARFYADGLLVIQDGRIKAFGPYKDVYRADGFARLSRLGAAVVFCPLSNLFSLAAACFGSDAPPILHAVSGLRSAPTWAAAIASR